MARDSDYNLIGGVPFKHGRTPSYDSRGGSPCRWKRIHLQRDSAKTRKNRRTDQFSRQQYGCLVARLDWFRDFRRPYGHKRRIVRKVIVLMSALFLLTGCATGGSEISAPEVKSTLVPLSGEEASQLRYCKSFDKAYGSLKSNGMTYETRDLFGDAYDIVHEQLLGIYQSSRYLDYNYVMSAHSFAWVSGSDVESLDGIATWCEEINTKLSTKTS